MSEKKLPKTTIREIEGYCVEAKLVDHHVDFVVYESDYPDDQHMYINGYVKWDGCSNWFWDRREYQLQLHFCDIGEIRRFGKLIEAMQRWAAELMPENKEDILHEGFE